MSTTDTTTAAKTRLTKKQRRMAECPVCCASAGKPCKSSRIPGANTLGGGWGGYPSLDREHAPRIAEARRIVTEDE